MTPAAIINEAMADGVSLTISTTGTIKATGDGAAVNRWLPAIREQKAGIVEALKVGAGDTADAEPVDREAWEERAAIAEFDGGLTRPAAETLAWREDDRRRCRQCLNLKGEACSIAKPGGLVRASKGYRPANLPMRCAGYSPKAGDTDQRAGAERWPGLAS